MVSLAYVAPLVGAAFFVFFEYIFGSLTEHWQILLGAIIVATLLYAREELLRIFQRTKKCGIF